MSHRALIATRKGLFTLTGGRARWRLSEPAFPGAPVSMALRDPRDGVTYAALALGHFGVKLHRSGDSGKKWEEIPAPAYPEAKEGEEEKPSVGLVCSLETGGPKEDGLLWAGTLPGGLFRSRDRGSSWDLIRSLWDRPERKEWMGGGYDHPVIHSICVDPRDSRRILLGVSCGGVWETRDGGGSWALRAKGMFAAYMPPERREDPNIQDPHRIVRCPGAPGTLWSAHHNGVFRTTDGAARWREAPNARPSVFGFAVAVHPRDPATAWLVPAVKDEVRIPVDGRFCVARTRDGGETFGVLRKGLPRGKSYDLVYRHVLEVDASGRVLVMGSTTGALWASEDQGDSWKLISPHLPPIYAVRFA